MKTTGRGHHKGDPTRFCERLTIEAGSWGETEQLALLFRVLSNPEQRARLLDTAERIEAEDLESAAVAPGAR